jgi:hypothetical protein
MLMLDPRRTFMQSRKMGIPDGGRYWGERRTPPLLYTQVSGVRNSWVPKAAIDSYIFRIHGAPVMHVRYSLEFDARQPE